LIFEVGRFINFSSEGFFESKTLQGKIDFIFIIATVVKKGSSDNPDRHQDRFYAKLLL
jgi:hypothetical protein